MKRLNLAMVGCGESGNDFALVSKLIPRVRFVAACDVNSERVQAFAQRHRIPAIFTEYSKLLAVDEIDAICLSTPHDLHYPMILSAIQAKKHVLTEKPLTRTYAEAQKLCPQIKGVKVGVNFQHRYDAGGYALVQAVQAGGLGKIFSVRINVPWHRTQKYFENSQWHKTIKRAGGATLITQASHFLDVVLWALTDMPATAMGYAETRVFDVEVDTLTHAIVETEKGTLISITSSMHASSGQPATIEMYGEKGTAFYKEAPFPSVRFKDVRIKKKRQPTWGVHAYQRSLAGFADWVLKDKPYLIPAEETLPVQAAIDAVYRSANSGKKESVL